MSVCWTPRCWPFRSLLFTLRMVCKAPRRLRVITPVIPADYRSTSSSRCFRQNVQTDSVLQSICLRPHCWQQCHWAVLSLGLDSIFASVAYTSRLAQGAAATLFFLLLVVDICMRRAVVFLLLTSNVSSSVGTSTSLTATTSFF